MRAAITTVANNADLPGGGDVVKVRSCANRMLAPRPPKKKKLFTPLEVLELRPAATLGAGDPLAAISRHVKHAMDATFDAAGHTHVVLLEEDLLPAPDFLHLFEATAWYAAAPLNFVDVFIFRQPCKLGFLS